MPDSQTHRNACSPRPNHDSFGLVFPGQGQSVSGDGDAAQPQASLAPALPRNVVWGLDLTGMGDAAGDVHAILGIVDHGSRACLALEAVKDKASITLLRILLDVIERFGKPKVIRADNEASLTSRLFRFGLWWLCIKHQRSAVSSPWMNGRVERFSGR